MLITGLVSQLPAYRIAWRLNKTLSIRLVRKDDIQLQDKEAVASFPMFSCRQPITHTVYYLIGNRSEGSIYCTSLKMVDYIFLLKGPYYNDRPEDHRNIFRSLEEIQAVIPVAASSIKQKDLFQF